MIGPALALLAPPSQILDPQRSWGAWGIVLGGLGVIAAVLFLLDRLDRKKRGRRIMTGLGASLFELDRALRPSKQHVRQAKQTKKAPDDAEGEGGPPEP